MKFNKVEPIIVEFPECKVIKVSGDNVYIKYLNDIIKPFNENIKVNKVSNFYCNNHKIIEHHGMFEDSLLLKNNTKLELVSEMLIKPMISFSKIWISDKSYGPVYDIIELNELNFNSKNSFIESSDSDEDFIQSIGKIKRNNLKKQHFNKLSV
jgi:hypothetical protein